MMKPTVSPPLLGIALLSATALAYEVLLTRLFAIIQWHHYAYMIISLALLGYGVSGSFLTLLGKRAKRHFSGFFISNAILFGISAVAGFLLAQQLPFNPLEMAWDYRQLAYLLIVYLLLTVPFFCVANCFGLALSHHGNQIHRIYACDLLGAGGGALGVIGLLFSVAPATALLLLGGLALAAALLAALECRIRNLHWAVAAVVVIGTLGLILPASWTSLRLSDYKELNQALRAIGAEKIVERSSPLGLVTAVRNDQVPFRYAPGMSLAAPVDLPEQWGLFSDGDSTGVITRFSGQREELAYLDYLTSALPYHLLQHPRVLVLGAGGGAEVLQAIYHRASFVDAVEVNPQIVELVSKDFSDFAGGLFNRPDVRVHRGEARGFVAASDIRYELIQIALLDAFSTASAGLYALSESYLYTVEAFEQYLRHLNPGGILAVTRWLRLPPRDSLKLFATAVIALEKAGIADPGKRLALLRGWKTSTLIVKNGRFSDADIESLRAFCQTRSFDLDYYPGISVAETNRFNVLDQSYLYEGARAMLGAERAAFFDRYKFDIRPATDDWPYFFHFLKWRTLPELLSLKARAGLGQLEWGYLILVATLCQALLISALLIPLPLWLGRQHSLNSSAAGNRWRVLLYFTAIGLGFMFLEIAFIQKFVLFLSHPLYAVAVVLCAFLVFAGLGSGFSQRFHSQQAVLVWVVIALTGWAIIYLLALPGFFQMALAWSDPVRICCAVALIAPLAFCMGMPFPLGLTRVSQAAPALVPWAWAINGCASVVSAVLGTLLAVHIGFSGVVIAALLFYMLAAVAVPRGEVMASVI
jgi:SAM-dependent methyltransferase